MSNRPRAASSTIDWDNLKKKLIDDKKCEMPHKQLKHPGYITVERSLFEFYTKSTYTGQWNLLGITGKGRFTFPYGVKYDGKIRDGMFHGSGVLTYPMGQKVEGIWNTGKLADFNYKYSDTLDYNNTAWEYCQMPDRRFFKCVEKGLRPAGRLLLTNNETTRRIPKGCYDTSDGYYNPSTKCVMSANRPGYIIRIPTKAEEIWIKQNCRKAWDEPAGYRPDLYEYWITGRESYAFNIKDLKNLSSTSSNVYDFEMETNTNTCNNLFNKEDGESDVLH